MRTYSEVQLKRLLEDRKLLVASHEAGASEILSSLLKRVAPENARYVLDGPARGIFRAKFPGIKIDKLSARKIDSIDTVITGASLIADLEREAIAMAKKSLKHSISILDNWVNFRERFVPVGKKAMPDTLGSFLPDEIWVADNYAYDTALQAGLPENKLALIGNYYLMDIKKNALRYKADNKTGTILYICEPVYNYAKLLKGHGNAWGYNEYDLIDDVLKSLLVLEDHFKKIIFRLHPTEDRKKYKKFLSAYSGKIEIQITSPTDTPLEEDCMKSDYVIGGESMALVVALFLNKKVFSCLPKNANKPCMLPHKEIIHINSLKEILNHIRLRDQ